MRTVSFIPKQSAERLETPVNLISINSPNEYTRLVIGHTRLLSLSFYPNDYQDMGEQGPTEKTARKIIDFMISCNEEDIVVHCGEGRIRSAAVAEFIERNYDYDVDYQAPGCIGSIGGASKNLYRLLAYTFNPYKRTIRRLKSTGHQIKAIDWDAKMVQYIPSHLKEGRFPGYVFVPTDLDGLTELTQNERRELYLSQFVNDLTFTSATLDFPTDSTDAHCLLDNNRIPTHKHVVAV
jgi:hypothetical protein